MQEHNVTRQQGLQSLSNWLESLGVTSVTGWRWRRKGWITTVNIAGRQYISAEAINAFQQRAAAGEFAKTRVVPKRQLAA